MEWLSRNDDCPCCRVEMISEDDVNKAAEIILKKARELKEREKQEGSRAENDGEGGDGEGDVEMTTTPPASPTPRSRFSPRIPLLGQRRDR